ncbi:unnamed protein product [Onchocerca ochengi]|uniref:Sushi domain-containing protein n=1 Tax=Onchocerca ochengi TaxID=42157 RepID=A0A182ERA5_ONCOC|nr:unnamed protein product [Onchocerca ochengi]
MEMILNDNISVPVLIWTKITNQSSKIYRIGSSELKREYSSNSGSDEIFLNSGIPTACPQFCTIKLSTNIRPSDGVIFHQDNNGEKPPPGYIDITGSNELFCARSFGDCGAKAPIYRYRNEINRYAYSFHPNESIIGYIREFNPICYGWKDSNNSIGKEILGTKDPTDCLPIPNIRNGQIIYKPSPERTRTSQTLIMGSFATLHCDEGYEPSVQKQIACITGTWYPTEELGECIPVSTGKYAYIRLNFFRQKFL